MTQKFEGKDAFTLCKLSSFSFVSFSKDNANSIAEPRTKKPPKLMERISYVLLGI